MSICNTTRNLASSGFWGISDQESGIALTSCGIRKLSRMESEFQTKSERKISLEFSCPLRAHRSLVTDN